MNIPEELSRLGNQAASAVYPEEAAVALQDFQERVPLPNLAELIEALELLEVEVRAVFVSGLSRNGEKVRQALNNLSDVRVKTGLISLALVLCLTGQVFAADLKPEIPVPNPTVMTVEVPDASEKVQKPSKIRVALRKTRRGIRWFCIKTEPVIRWVGSAAQVVTAIAQCAG